MFQCIALHSFSKHLRKVLVTMAPGWEKEVLPWGVTQRPVKSVNQTWVPLVPPAVIEAWHNFAGEQAGPSSLRFCLVTNYFCPFDMQLEGTDPCKWEGAWAIRGIIQLVPGRESRTLSLGGNRTFIMGCTRALKLQRRWIQPAMKRTQFPFCLPFFSCLSPPKQQISYVGEMPVIFGDIWWRSSFGVGVSGMLSYSLTVTCTTAGRDCRNWEVAVIHHVKPRCQWGDGSRKMKWRKRTGLFFYTNMA